MYVEDDEEREYRDAMFELGRTEAMQKRPEPKFVRDKDYMIGWLVGLEEIEE